MSRSYKKTPVVKLSYGNTVKIGKKLSNRKIRKQQDMSNGSYFKKVLNTRNIYEFKSYSSLKQDILKNKIYKVYSLEVPLEKVIEKWQRKYYRK